MHKSIYYLFNLLLFCMISCSDYEFIQEQSEIIPGELVEVTFGAELIGSTAETRLVSPAENLKDSSAFSVSGMPQIRSVETRADVSQPETWFGRMVQYDNTGKKLYVSDPFQATRNDNELSIQSCSLQMGSNMQLFLLLVKNEEELPDFADMNSLADYQITLNNSFALADHLPLYGKVENVTITRNGIEGNSLSFPLTRLGCKINLKYNCYASGYKISTIRVKNIPTKASLSNSKGTTNYPVLNTTDDLTNADVITLKDGNAWKPQEGTVSFYLLANARGEGTDKNSITDEVADKAHYTFIELECEHESNPLLKVSLRFYPGADNSADYNLRENYEYTARINVWKVKEKKFNFSIPDQNNNNTSLTDVQSMQLTFSDGSIGSYPFSIENNNKGLFALPALSQYVPKVTKIQLLDGNDNQKWVADVWLDLSVLPENNEFTIIANFEGILRDGFYEVSSYNNLSKIDKVPTNGDKKFKQMGPIIAPVNSIWTPKSINNKIEYDGQGYLIDNLNIKPGDDGNGGLFGRIDNSTLKGIRIGANCKFSSSSKYQGALVAEAMNNCTIEDCSSEMTINVTDNTDKTGSLIGFANTPTIINCYAKGYITGAVSNTNIYCGGLIGHTQNNVSIKNSYAAVTISATNVKKGGLVGKRDNARWEVNNTFYLWAEGLNAGENTPAYPNLSKSASDMQSASFVTTLNSGSNPAKWEAVPNDYPRLVIEKP